MPPKGSKVFKPSTEPEQAQASQVSPQGAKKRRAFNIPQVTGNAGESPVLSALKVSSSPQDKGQKTLMATLQSKQQTATPLAKGPSTGLEVPTPAGKGAPPLVAQAQVAAKQTEPPLKAARVEPQPAQPVLPTVATQLTQSTPPTQSTQASQPSQPSPQRALAKASSPEKPAVVAPVQPSPPKPAAPPKATSPAPAPVATAVVPAAPAASPVTNNLPLTGMVFCFTGELETFTRQDGEEKVKAAGGKVMGTCSGNSTYLVVGSRLEDGRKVEETAKYRKYMELKEKGKKCPELLTEEQLIAKLPAAAAPRAKVAPLPMPVPSPGVEHKKTTNWVDTYAPKSFADLIGNSSTVRKLTEWLRDWDDVVLKGKKKPVAFRPGGGQPDNVNARAALVSGPPGIGKTTTCRLVSQLHGGYEILEFNASDARGQKIIQQMAEGIADNTTISFGGNLQKKNVGFTRRAVIIMDEVDGMGAGDRGGNAALIKMIKKTRNPIICICNDQHSQKVRSLAFSCYDIKFQRPPKGPVAQRCAEIAKREGLDVEPNALEELAESCGGDMRMVLNQMQAISKNPTYQAEGVKYNDMKQQMHTLCKDQALMLSPFDAAKKLLNSSEASRLSLRDRLDMFFVDFNLVGLLVQENYLRTVERRPADLEVLNRCAYSADLIAVGDIMSTRITQNQDWSLLPDVGLTSAVYPTFITNGFVPFPSFPSFLGKYSTMSRTRRLSLELQAHLRLSSTVSKRHLLTSGFCDLLYNKLITPLQRGDMNGTVSLLDSYGLRKEHLTEHLTELRGHLGGKDIFKEEIDTKVKAAMTREFNSGCHAMRVLLPASKKRKAEAEHPEGEEEDDGAGAAAEDEGAEGSDDDTGASSLVKAKKAGAKARGKAKAKAAASSVDGSPDDKPKAKGRGRGKAKAKA